MNRPAKDARLEIGRVPAAVPSERKSGASTGEVRAEKRSLPAKAVWSRGPEEPGPAPKSWTGRTVAPYAARRTAAPADAALGWRKNACPAAAGRFSGSARVVS